MDIQRKAFESAMQELSGGQTKNDVNPVTGEYQYGVMQVMWSVWQKAQAVPEWFVVVPMEPTEQILNRMTNTPIEVNHLCDNADIFLSEDEARIAYKAMIEAQEPAND